MRLTRRGRLAVTVTAAAALLLAGTSYLLTRTTVGAALGVPIPPPCRITADGHTREWSRVQAMTATTVAGVGVRIGATLNGVAVAVDQSLAARPAIAVTSAQALAVYRRPPVRTAPPAAALALARALLGESGRALTCTVPLVDRLPREDPDRLGLTGRAETMRLAMRDVFGKQTLGGFAAGGITTGHVEGSAHYQGRAIDVFFRPVTAEQQRRGWVQAQWAVAHSDRLHIATVIFDRAIWTAEKSISGWRDYAYPGGPTQNPILLHLDHMHVDVVEGG
ncbi:MAG: hypothetical protein QOH80_1903 [Actinomycetota bacterium]|nr:hypothetical protein [Actinomycetota bacterium]